jgi:CubicO group peptidase (beta-lactamase class C family)
MTNPRRVFWIFLAVLAILSAGTAVPRPDAAGRSDDPLALKIDTLLDKTFKAGEPGAALLVKKDGRVMHRKGYGTADLELGIPIEPDMSFRLGSITKQFTAVSILMLEETGKLSVKDPIEKFLPDFPTQGRTITIENLLTHTSGVVDYTSLAEWLPLWRKDMSVSDIIGLFKDKPPDFAPGEHWKYSNSGYILLGAIIEKASGETYENFVQKNIFGPLGMKHSYYGSASRVLSRRIPGYGRDRSGFFNAPCISMTQPYAAGSLLSSVDDLALWNEALLANTLVKKESLERAWAPFKLNDGTSTGYGYGWSISDYQGHRLIEHGGGIMGFSTYGMLFPEDRALILLLTNSAIEDRAPAPFAEKIADLVLGIAPKELKAVPLGEKDLSPLLGVYADWEKTKISISREGTKVFAQISGGAKREIVALSPLEFAYTDRPTRLAFEKNAAAEIVGLTVRGRSGMPDKFVRTAAPLPSERKVAAVDPKIYDRYIGEYTLTPEFILSVTVENGTLMAQATGQPKVQLFPESETSFFLKVVDAQVEFQVDQAGKVTGLVLTQGGQKIPAKKTK